jgi:mucin-19
VTGVISGTGSVTSAGGTIVLSGANTYSGGTTITGGVIGAYHNTALGTGTLTIGDATLRIGRTVTTLANAITLTGAVTADLDATVEYLIVGGGGGGGGGQASAHGGGGGGGGGVRTGSADYTANSYSVTVGAGGTGGLANTYTGAWGGSSALGTVTALGGGYGGQYFAGAPTTGASGGGGAVSNTVAWQSGAVGTAGQGYAGGNANGASPNAPAGGGGGAGGAGGNFSGTTGGVGGLGLANAISGTQSFYGAGGGGGGTLGGTGGSAVGGAGGSFATAGTAGTANSGSGGGGGMGSGGGNATNGGAGGAGVVVVRYLGPSAGTGGTITAGTNLAAGYTLHTFTTTGASTLTLSAGLTATLSGAITGTGAFTADATGGTITLSGANTYDGATTIPGGTVRVGAGGATGALGAGAITNNGSLVFNRTGTVTVAVEISGTGTLEQAGTGTTVLEGVNTYSGATTVSAGTLAITDAAGLGTTAAGTTVASGATLDLRGVVVGAEAITLNGGTLATSTGTSSLSSAVTLGASSTLSVAGTQLTLSGIISGVNFGLTKSGTGVAVLAGANTFTGNLAVDAGTLRIGGAGRLSAGTYVGAITVASGATFDFTSSANQIFGAVTSGNVNNAASNTLRGAGKHVFGGTGAITLRGDFSASGTIEVAQAVTMAGGTNSSNAGLGQTSAIDIKDGGTITLAGGANSFIGVGAAPSLTIRSGGKLTTDGSAGQTFHLGLITLAGGELATGVGATATGWGLFNLDKTVTVTEDSTLSAQFSLLYQSGGTVFNVAAGKTLTVSGTLNLPTNGGETPLILNSAAGNTGTMLLTGTNTFATATTITRGTLRIGGAGSLGSGTYANTITNNGALEIATSANQTFSNVISGSGSVTKSGAGTTTLTATNNYAGTTTVSAGVLQVGNGGTTGSLAASSAASIASGATLRYYRADASAFSVAHAVSGDGTLEFRGTGANGVGSFRLTGANTLSSSAVMVLNQAVLSVGTQAELSASLPLVRIMSGGLLYVERGGTYGNPLELGAGLGWKFSDASQLGLLHANAWVTPGAVTFTGNVTLTGNSAIAAWANSSDLTMSGVISDGGNGFGFTKLGLLKLTLTGANTFTGTTTISAGTVQVGAGGTAGVLGGAVVNNSALIFDRSDALTFAPAISGTGTLTKAGANTLTLTGANTYTGSTTVTAGGIIFQRDVAPSTSGFAGAGTVTIESAGAAFTSAVASYTYTSTITGLTLGKSTNTSAVTLGAAISIAGPVTVYGGSIAVNSLISATGDLLLDADTGAQLAGNFTGLAIAANLSTTAGSNGSITLRGRGGNNSAGGQHGVTFTGVTVSAGGTGAVLIEGTGGASVGANNIGIRSAGTITTGAGNLTLTGIAGGTGASSNNDGIAMMSGAIARTVGGALLLDGTNGPGSSSESIAFETATSAVTFGQVAQTGSTTLRGDALWVSTNNVSLLGSGVITIEPKGTSFSSALSTDKFTIPSAASGFTFGKAGNTAALTVASNLSIAGPISVFGGDVTLTGGVAATAAGDVLVRSSGVLTIAASRVLSATNGDVTLTAGRFVNNGGSGALSAGGTGKTWRVWSTNADPYHVSTGDVAGGLAFDFRQYDASYGVTTVQGTGKGLLYSFAPSLSASLTTTPTKVYDQTDTATVTNAMVTVASGYAGGDGTAVFTFSAATYASRNAGNGQAITFASAPTVVAQSSAGTGGKPVYGYRISGLSAPTGNITPRDLTLTGVTAANKVYDRTLAAVIAGGAVTPLSGDTVTVDMSSATGAFANWNVGSAKSVTVSGAILGGAEAGNYSVAQPVGLVANITARPLSVTSVSVADKVYNRALAATLSGGAVTALSGDTVTVVASGASGSFADWNVGTAKAVTVTGYALGGAQAGNYSVVQPNGVTGNITPLSLAVTGVTAANKVYDRTVAATLSGGAIAPISGDTVTLDDTYAAGVFANWNVGTAKAVTVSGYALGGAQAANYAIVQPAGVTANITQATLQVLVNSDAKFVSVADPANFNGVSLSGFLAGDSATDVTGTATITRSNAGINAAGTYAGVLTGSGLSAQNYAMSYVPGDFTIVPADRVLVRVASESVIYGNAPVADIQSVQYYNGSTGLVVLSRVGATNTFDDGVVGGNGTVAFSVVAANPLLSAGGNLRVGTYDLGVDVASLVITGTNFSGTPVVAGKLNVTPRSVQVAGITAADKTYDRNTGATVSGGAIAALTGDAVAVSTADVVASFADKLAANGKSVTASGYALTGADAANYQIVQPAAVTADITRLSLAVTGASAADKTYDALVAAAVSGGAISVLAGDTVTLDVTSRAGVFANKHVGAGKSVTVSGYTITGADAANYALVQPTGLTADITALTLNITGATAANKTYDALLTAAISGGAISAISGDTVTLVSSGRAGVFADKNVGTGKAITVSGYTLSGADAGNYALVQPTGVTADISARTLNVTGATAANKTYDALLGATISGGTISAISGDAVTLSSAQRAGVFADKNVGTGKSVTVSGYEISGADAGNYFLVQPTSLTANITALTLNVTGATAANKTYDALLTATISGGAISAISGDVVTLVSSGRAGVFADKNVGNGKAVTVSGYALSGADAGNYSLVQPTGLTANITPLTLNVTGATAANKTYDALLTATISGGTISVLSGDTVTLSTVDRAGLFGDKNAATGKAVTVTGYSISGTDADNYSLVQPAGVTANITPLALNVTDATAANKTYDALLGTTISGGAISALAGDTVALVVSGRAGVFTDKNVGTTKSVTVSGYALSGTDAVNYSLVQPTGVTANITALTLNVTGATAANKVYDALLAATISGGAISILSGDTVTLVSSGRAGVFADKNVGAGKDVTVSGYTLTGTDAGNYALVQPAGVTADITPLSLSVTGVIAANKVYDRTVAATLSGGAIAPISGDTVTLDATYAVGVFANRNVGTAKAVTVSGYALSGAQAANYAIAQPAGVTANITPATLQVVVKSDAKFVSTADPSNFNGVTLSGFLAGDTLADVTGSATITRTNAGINAAGTYAGVLTASGLTAQNYAMSYVPGDFTIVPADRVLVRVTSETVTYGTVPVSEIESVQYFNGVTGLVVLSRVGGSSTFDDGVVGGNGTVTFSVVAANPLLSAGGNLRVGTYGLDVDAGSLVITGTNFSGTPVVAGSLSVTPLSVRVAGLTAANKTYDGNSGASVTGGTIAALVDDAVAVSTAGVVASFVDKMAANGKSVTATGYVLTGADAANYQIVQPAAVTANITKRSLAVTGATAADKTYDALLTAAISGGAISVVSGDTVTLDKTNRAGVFADKNVGTTKAVTVSGYTISGADAANYSLVQPTGVSANITALTLNVTGATAANKTYDAQMGATISGGAISIIAGDTVTLDTTNRAGVFADKHVGSGKSVTVTGYSISGTDAANYALAQPTGLTADITHLTLNVTGATAANKTYDALLAAAVSGGAISVVSGDTVNLVSSGRVGVFGDKNVGAGKSVTVSGYTLSGSDAGNYSLVQPTGVTANITARTLNVTGATAANKTYDALLTAAISGGGISVISGDTVTLEATNRAGVFVDKNVGTGKAVTVTGYTITGTDAANYALAQPTGVTANITPRTLNVTGATAADKTYDALLTAAISGGAISVLAGDTVTLDATNPAGVFADKHVGSGKTVTVSAYTITGTDAGNYALVQPTGVTADITQLTLNVTGATAADKTYDALLGATISGGAISVISGDTVTLVSTGRAGVFADKNVGNGKAVTVSGYTLSGAEAGNYALVQPTGLTADITALTLNVTGATAANKVYDALLTATISGGAISAIAGDAVTLVGSGRAGVFSDKNVGTGKSVSVTGYTISGADAGNYALVQPTGVSADITSLTLNVTGATAADKTYDALLAAAISGGAISVISGDTVVLDVTNRAGVFADKNVGNGKAVTVSGYALSGADAANYALLQPTGITSDITPLTLNVTGATAASKTYDALRTAVISGGVISAISGDTVNLSTINRAGLFADKNVGTTKAVTISGYTISGTDAANYALVQPTGVTAAITALTFNVTGATAANKTYDALLAAAISGGAISAIAGDTVTLDTTHLAGAFADKNVGPGKGVTVTGFAITGTDAGNYALIQPAGLTADITSLTLNVTGATAANKTYDALLGATISGGAISAIAGDTVNLVSSGRIGVFGDKNVANGKAVTVSGYSISGADAANYTLVQPTGVTADITALTLNVTGATAANKTYDALVAAAISGGTISTIVGDTVLLDVSGRTGVFGDKNVANGKAVTVTGYTISGADAGNYSLVQPTGVTANIAQLTLNVTGATAASKTYDALLGAVISGGAVAPVSGDTVNLDSSGRMGVFTDKNVASGKAVTVTGYTISGTDAANYSLVQPAGLTADITPLTLTVTGATAANKTYDALVGATISGGVVSVISGDDVTLATSGRAGVFADKHVANGKSVTVSGYTITGTDAGNYTLVQPTGVTADITALTLNVAGATAANKTYNALLGAVISGGAISAIAGDIVNLDISGRTGVFGDKNVANGKAVTVTGYTISGTDAANYSLVQPTGLTADIAQLTLNVTGATAASKTYDALLGAVISGGAVAPISGDTVNLDISGRTGVFADKNVANGKAVTVTGYTISGTDAANYSLVQPAVLTADITALTLNVTGATAANKTYDALVGAIISGGVISVISGDDVTLTTSGRTGVFADKNVANGKAVTVSGYGISGADSANYSLVQPTGVTADITALTLNVTGATAANKTYDALVAAAISGGAISVIAGDAVTLDSTNRAGVFGDKNVGTTKFVTVTGYSLTGTDAANYDLVQPAGLTADIAALTLNVTGASATNKTYDALLTAAISGGAISAISGDIVSLDTTNRAGVFADKNVGTGKSVTVSGYSLTGADAGNYNLIQPTGVTADITQLTLNITGATAGDKTYDAQLTAAISGGVVSAISGDDVVLGTANRAGMFADKNVGASKAVTVSGYSISGADAANYSLVQPTGVTANITQLTLDLNGVTAADKTYDALLTAGIAGGSIAPISGDYVTLDTSARSGLFVDKNVGTAKAVTISGYAISGADAGNYALVHPTGVIADITPLALNITGVTATGKTYDALRTAAISGGAVTAIAGDLVTLDDAGRAGLFADKNIGTSKTVTVSGYAISGVDATNYSLVQPTGVNADITPAGLVISGLSANDKTYDRSLSATLTGGAITPIAGDTVTLDSSTVSAVFVDWNVGAGKPVNVSGYTLSGADAGNYVLTQPSGLTAAIFARSLPVVGVVAANKLRNGSLNAEISGGSIAPLAGDTVTLDASAAVGLFLDDSIGTGKPVVVSGFALAGLHAGNYAIAQPTGVTAGINDAGIFYPPVVAPPVAVFVEPVATTWAPPAVSVSLQGPAQAAPQLVISALSMPTSAPDVVPVGTLLSLTTVQAMPVVEVNIEIVGGFVAGDTVLQVNAPEGLKVSVDDKTGKVTISGNGSSADYDKVLKTLAVRSAGGKRVGGLTLKVGVNTAQGGKSSTTVQLRQGNTSAGK